MLLELLHRPLAARREHERLARWRGRQGQGHAALVRSCAEASYSLGQHAASSQLLARTHALSAAP